MSAAQQYGLFERPPAVRHRETSVEAAESMREGAAALRAKVYRCIAQAKDGATCDEVEVALNLRHQTASARVNELMRSGEIVESGRRPTRSGRRAIVWKAA